MQGKIVCELIPTPDNKRNSEGAFINLKDGSILYAYTRYHKGSHDHDPADVYGIISKDDGETWGEPFLIITAASVGAHNLMSISLMRMNNGDLGLIYLRKDNVQTTDGSIYLTGPNSQGNITQEAYAAITCAPWIIRSADEGKTWSEPLKCITTPGYYVLCNDRMIRLDSGRWLMPISHIGFTKEDTISFYASDDDGYTWKALVEDIPLPLNLWHSYGSFNASAMEPGVVQLKDGTIWCFIRTRMSVQYEMFSHDNGETWTTPNPSRFTSANSPMSARKLSDNKIFVIWNPIPRFLDREYKGQYVKWKWSRTPYACALLSETGGKFLMAEDFETDRDRGFCYGAVHETPAGDILLGYCAGNEEEDGDWLNRVRITKMYKSDIMARVEEIRSGNFKIPEEDLSKHN